MSIDEKEIKASYKDCPVSERARFKQSRCIMPISVGQPVHEGAKFKATLDLINRTFHACTILIDDSIQSHTMKIFNPEMAEKELYERAIRDGDLWIERNEHLYKQLTIEYDVIRWDKWRLHKNFNQQLAYINSYYDTNQEFRDSVNAAAAEYLKRNQTKSRQFNYQDAYVICLEYLKEECAAMTLWTEGNYQFEVYPTGRNTAMSATYNHLIVPYHPDLLKSVSIRFKKY